MQPRDAAGLLHCGKRRVTVTSDMTKLLFPIAALRLLENGLAVARRNTLLSGTMSPPCFVKNACATGLACSKRHRGKVHVGPIFSLTERIFCSSRPPLPMRISSLIVE